MRSLVFPVLLFSSISLHWSLRKAYVISPCYCLELCIWMLLSFLFSFAFCFSFQYKIKKFLKRSIWIKSPACCTTRVEVESQSDCRNTGALWSLCNKCYSSGLRGLNTTAGFYLFLMNIRNNYFLYHSFPSISLQYTWVQAVLYRVLNCLFLGDPFCILYLWWSTSLDSGW